MKKLVSLLALLLVGGLIANEAWAEDYSLRVAGVKVTSSNASKITGTGISGTVSYDNDTKTLTLKSATITCETSGGIVNTGIDGLTILVNGNSEVSSDYNAVYSTKSTTIRSDNFSSLTITANNPEFCGIWMKDDSALTIEDIWMRVTAAFPLLGDGKGSLQLNRCNVVANGTTDGFPCVKGFTTIGTQGVIYNYNGYTYDETDMRMEDSSGKIAKSHTFRPRIAVGQYIWNVRDDQVISNTSPRAGVSSGTITYKSSSHTLTLDNVTMSSGSYAGIRYYGPFYADDLNIEVKGTNTINVANGSGSPGIFANGNGVHIYGSGTQDPVLTINNTRGDGIGLETADGKPLAINNMTLNVTSKEHRSINGGGTAKLSIYNSTVSAALGITGFTDCTLNASYVRNGGEFSPSLKGFTDDGKNIYDGEVQIYPGYDLVVCGERVTLSNKGNILGDGQFSYDSGSNTLTLKNAVASTNGNCISNRIKGLAIKVEGSASLTSTGSHAIYSTKSCSLTSDTFADVTIKSTSSDSFAALWMDGEAQMTIKKVWLEATGTYPIYGSSNSKLALVLCNVYAKSTGNRPCVSGFSELVTSGVIYDYDGVSYETNNKRMVNSDGQQLTEHTMKPRLAVRKYIWDPRNDAAIDNSTPGAGLDYGTISYSKDGTLTLNNVSIDAGKYNGISYYGPVDGKDLIIKLKGDNVISNSATGKPIFCYGNNLTICPVSQSPNSPTPELTLNPRNATGIAIKGENTLAIRDIALNVTATANYFSLYGNGNANLEIHNSEVVLDKSLSNFTSLYMAGCDIAEPEGAWFLNTLKAITLNGSDIYSDKVVINDVDYGMYIGETRVMASNAYDILGDGHFRYIPGARLLNVTDADLEDLDGPQGGGIDNRNINGLVINLEGDNHITARNSAIYSAKPFSIIGLGTLTASANDFALFFGGQCTECTIAGPTLLLNSRTPICDYHSQTTLELLDKKTYVELQPEEGYPAISKLKDLQMNGSVKIVKPKGAWFDPSLHGITVDGNILYAGNVVFYGGNIADVNRDGSVDVADIGCIIDAMTGSASGSLADNADVNNDGTVDVADIGAVIDAMAASARLQSSSQVVDD